MTGFKYFMNNIIDASGQTGYSSDDSKLMFISIKVEHFREAMKRDEYNINKQVEILQEVLNELMTGFESPEERMDFILDIVNGYKKRII